MLSASPAVTAPGDTANLRITKSDSPDPVTVGQTLTYTIEVSNLGPDPATGTTVTDRLPANVDFVSAQSTSGNNACDRNGRTVTCQVGTLGGSFTEATITIRVKPRRAGTITNTAEVDSVENDPVAANNEATTTTTVKEAGEPQPATCRGTAATILGTANADVLRGTPARDVIVAFAGNDTIYAFGGRDLICGNRGADLVGAGPRADVVVGGPGNDRVRGRGGSDRLIGNNNNDVLRGNRGNDVMRGGLGTDRCFGGPGVDVRRGCEN